MDLITNGTIVTDAIKYITQKQEKIDTLKMIDERIGRLNTENGEGEEATTCITAGRYRTKYDGSKIISSI